MVNVRDNRDIAEISNGLLHIWALRPPKLLAKEEGKKFSKIQDFLQFISETQRRGFRLGDFYLKQKQT